MEGPSKKMRISDEVFYELLQENECSDISESDSKVNCEDFVRW
jgi:hypothetical protein